ncbi:unnamed protein product [Ectocarpus sp. 6 AP-2014]
MKSAVMAAACVSSASAFVAPSLVSSRVTSSAPKTTMMAEVPGSWWTPSDGTKSVALPWADKPLIGDGDMVGDAGFDPLNLANGPADLVWLRTAELKHGRICMLACVGMVAPELVQHPVGFSGFEFAPEFTQMNAFAALSSVPRLGLAQIVILCSLIEVASFTGNLTEKYLYEDDLTKLELKNKSLGKTDYLAGAAKIAPVTENKDQVFEDTVIPGDLGFDPLGLAANGVNPDYALAELKHARLAMIGFLGMAVQQSVDPNGGVLEQFMNWAS